MPDLPTPICVDRLCNSLRTVRDHASEVATAIDSALARLSDEMLRLVFIELSASAVVIIRADGAYLCPAENQQNSPDKSTKLPRWLVYRARASCSEQPGSNSDPATNANVDKVYAQSEELIEALTRFDFFHSLKQFLPRIAVYDAELVKVLSELLRLRESFAEQLDGHSFGLQSAVALAVAEDNSVKLALVLDWDELHPQAYQLPASDMGDASARGVVLLGRDVRLDPCRLTRLSECV